MEAIPRKYGEWGQFDRYCKLVLYHEAIDYLREMKCRRDREVSLDAVSPADWDKLSTVDRYSCDSFTFSSHGKNTRLPLRKRPNIFGSGKTNCVGLPRKTPPLAG